MKGKMKGKINDLNKMKGNKIKAILLIAVFILSTLAAALPFASAGTLTVVLTKIPATATHSSIELETVGTGTADWTIAQKKSGIYSVRLDADTVWTDVANVVIELDTPIAVEDLDELSYWVYATQGDPAHVNFYVDVDGDGVWDADVDDILVLCPWNWQEVYEWKMWGGMQHPKGIEVTATTNHDPGAGAWYPDGGDRGMPDWGTAQGTLQWLEITLDITDAGTVVSSRAAMVLANTAPYGYDKILLPWSYWQTGVTTGEIADPDATFTGGRITDAITTWNFNPKNIEKTDKILSIEITAKGTGCVPRSKGYVDKITINTVTYDLEPSGNVEDTVTVSGTGATEFSKVDIYWDDYDTKIFETTADSTTAYTKDITIPTDMVGTHYIIVKDRVSEATAFTAIEIEPEITLDPTAGVLGDTIAVTGTGFAADSVITITTDPTIVTVPSPVPTDEFGSFTCEFDIVTGMEENELVRASDTSNEATAYLDVGTVLTLTPKTGIVGTTVTVEGKGFSDSGTATVDIRWYLDGTYITRVDDEDIGTDGEFSATFLVPLVADPSAPGDDYTVKAFEGTHTDPDAVAIFTVVEDASITLSEEDGRPEETFTVLGDWFTASSTVTITFDGTELATDVSTSSVGSFSAQTVEVPDLAPGDYTVTATDAEDVTASETYTILPVPALVIYTRETEYMPGDTVTFYINATLKLNIAIDITDPSEYPSPSIAITDPESWTAVGDYYVVTSDIASFELPSDATEGYWNWTAAYEIESESVVDTDLFLVGELVGPPPDQPAETDNADALDPDGVPKTDFVLGETITITADVTNQESEDQPVIVVFQLFDAAYRPLPIFSFRTTLTPGQVMTSRPDFPIPTTGYTPGTWTAEINVLDDWPAQEGIAIALPKIIEFEVS